MKRQRTAEPVRVKVKGKGVTVTPELREQVEQKMRRLGKYLDRLSDLEVELCHERTRESSRRNSVETTAHVLGRTVRVTASHEEMHAAIDGSVDKLYRQLNRHKERIKSHHGTRLAEAVPESVVDTGEAADATSPPREIQVEHLDMKPIFEEEAVEEMDAQGRDFYVFLNARNEQVSVLYRRTDGGYALIEPKVG